MRENVINIAFIVVILCFLGNICVIQNLSSTIKNNHVNDSIAKQDTINKLNAIIYNLKDEIRILNP